VVKAARAHLRGGGDGVFGADDVGHPQRLLARGHVVQAGDVKEVSDAAAQLRELLRAQAEPRSAQISDHRHDAAGARVPPGEPFRKARQRRLADQDMNRPAASGEQPFDQMATDEARSTGDEVPVGPTCRGSSLLRHGTSRATGAIHSIRQEPAAAPASTAQDDPSSGAPPEVIDATEQRGCEVAGRSS
jgi:hypothetical protein